MKLQTLWIESILYRRKLKKLEKPHVIFGKTSSLTFDNLARKEKQESIFSGFSSPSASTHLQVNTNPLPLRSRQHTDLETMSADTFGRSPQAKISSPKVKVQEILRKEKATAEVIKNTIPPANRESYFADYNRKVKDVMGTIEDFMVAEINTLKKDKLPAEYYQLRRNFDILYRVFKVAFFTS